MPDKRISTSAFTLELNAQRERMVELVFHGELDLSVAIEARQLVEQELSGGNDVEIDLAGLEFVDSSGLQTLFRMTEHAATVGRSLTFTGTPQSQVRRVLRLSGLMEFVFPTR